MSTRTIEARISKLESHSIRDGEYYLLWRLPGDEASAAVEAAQLPRGTKVICPEWFGELPPPQARWIGGDERLPKHETDSIYEAAKRRYFAKCGCNLEDVPSTRGQTDSIASQMTDVELDFAIFGVTVQ